MIEWLSIGYSALKDFLKYIQNKKGLSPEEIVKRRQRWKDEIKEKFQWIDDKVGYGQIIIRDVKRNDMYPKVEERKKGISSWFRVGYLGTYYRGIEVGLGINELIYEEKYKAWRFAEYKNKEEGGDLNAYIVGLIPFEYIANIDWNGDEYYSCPHIYCHFLSKKGEPKFWSGTITPEEWSCYYAMLLKNSQMDPTSIADDNKVISEIESYSNGGMEVLIKELLVDFSIGDPSNLRIDSSNSKDLSKSILAYISENI